MTTSGIYDRRIKRSLDLVIAAAALVVTSPLHALCALAVRLTSGRPVYYRQERAGRDGKPFRLVKLRTMKVGTHELTGGYPTSDMLTPAGQLLRRTSLDELPQLWNILRGDMSLVGPRPALPEQVARYTEAQACRLTVRPGLTGLAQVRYRNAAPWSVRIAADLEYVRAVSLAHDLRILFRTLPAVLFGAGVVLGQEAGDIDDLGERRPQPGPAAGQHVSGDRRAGPDPSRSSAGEAT